MLDAEQVKKIIAALGTGTKLKTALLENDVSSGEFFSLIYRTPELLESYNSYQRGRAEKVVEEILDIAEEEVDPQRARVRMDARRWYASKMIPHKYGERIDLNVNQIVDIGLALSEARARVRLISDQENKASSKLLDITPTSKLLETGYKPVNDEQRAPNAQASEPLAPSKKKEEPDIFS
jgi:hypothetical protein